MGILDKIASKKRKGKKLELPEAMKPKGGKKIAGSMLRTLEKAFGEDLSEIRIHRDEDTDKLLEDVGVTAFTQGDHIYIESGGLKIDALAYEVSHALQQREGQTLKGKKAMQKP